VSVGRHIESNESVVIPSELPNFAGGRDVEQRQSGSLRP